MHPGVLHRRFLNDLSSSLFSFVLPLLPTNEELTVKEEVRGLIEKLIKTIEPSARLLSFGSSCNSFGLRNSDMDLVVLIDDPAVQLEPAHLVAMMGDLLERETNFDVKPLPKARIPILKLTLAPSPALPFGIACDIGIENRLAIENTRLLLTYATIDPARVRTLVLFLKVWAKRRRINSPYRGTLSSYGFTLMVLYFLVHVKHSPVLPNLQRIAPVRPLSEDQVMLQGRNVYFFDDVETLRQEWSSINYETVGELLIDFFRYFSHDFQFNNSVLSLRAGPLTKESKGWVNDIDVGGLNEMARDRNRLCIEDPFEITYNVARTVTKDGLYTIRGEFMRATRILTQRPDRAVLALAELCQEREDDVHRAPRSASPAPGALPANRGAFTAPMRNGPFQNHNQLGYDRLAPGAHYEPQASARRGRQSVDAAGDYSAQELWLASQGPNLGGVSGLGLGFDGVPGSRGRDPAQRGPDSASSGFRNARRAVSAYETGENPGSGSISAPLSPHKLYAQLEMGKNLPSQPSWTSSTASTAGGLGYDPRLHGNPGLPMYSGSTHRSGQLNQNNNLSHTQNSRNPRSASLVPSPNPASVIAPPEESAMNMSTPPSPLPAFTPFSPNPPPSRLKPLNGEPASYISPSTLLSPPQDTTALPSDLPITSSTAPEPRVDNLVEGFARMGVDVPGQGVENPSEARREEVAAQSQSRKSSYSAASQLSRTTSPIKKPTL